jgi:hypothetical protein
MAKTVSKASNLKNIDLMPFFFFPAPCGMGGRRSRRGGVEIVAFPHRRFAISPIKAVSLAFLS